MFRDNLFEDGNNCNEFVEKDGDVEAALEYIKKGKLKINTDKTFVDCFNIECSHCHFRNRCIVGGNDEEIERIKKFFITNFPEYFI